MARASVILLLLSSLRPGQGDQFVDVLDYLDVRLAEQGQLGYVKDEGGGIRN